MADPQRLRATIEFDYFREDLERKRAKPRTAPWVKVMPLDPSRWSLRDFVNLQSINNVQIAAVRDITPVDQRAPEQES